MSSQPIRCAAALLLISVALCGQEPAPEGVLRIQGVPGEAQVISFQGKRYVEIEALVQLLGAMQQTEGRVTTLVLKPVDTAPRQDEQKLSRDFLTTGIELVSGIREWRQSLIHAVVNNTGFLDLISGPYERGMDARMAAASAAASTDADRDALALLQSETDLMRRFNAYYLDRWRKALSVFPEDIENDALGKQILECARGMAAMAASHQYQDVEACHPN